jgi:glucan phosphorylase
VYSNYSIFGDDFVFVVGSSDFLNENQEDGLGIILVCKYSSENINLNVSANGYRFSEGQEPQNFSQTNQREYLPESVGFSASTRKVHEKHTSQTSYEVDHEKKRNLIKIKLWEGLAVGCLCLSLLKLSTFSMSR